MKLFVTLPLHTGSAIVDDVLAIARRESLHPITVVVVDAGGKLVAMKSEDGSGLLRFGVAFGKAWGALGMGISSRLIRDRLSARPVFQNALIAASGGQLVPVPGGVLIENNEGYTIGAVGISGDTSEKDEYCAIAAIQKNGLQSEPAEADKAWRDSNLSDQPHDKNS
jgi:uncharacterized protein GlcG (DUF336 family)